MRLPNSQQRAPTTSPPESVSRQNAKKMTTLKKDQDIIYLLPHLAPPWSPHASFSPTPTAAPWLKSGSVLGCLTTDQVPILQGLTVHWVS